MDSSIYDFHINSQKYMELFELHEYEFGHFRIRRMPTDNKQRNLGKYNVVHVYIKTYIFIRMCM